MNEVTNSQSRPVAAVVAPLYPLIIHSHAMCHNRLGCNERVR